MSTRFDAGFYRHFYINPRTRVTTRSELERRAATVAALMKQLELPVARILDAGCGLGWMRPALLREFPRASYLGLEVSEHLCREYGWTCESLATFRHRGRFDLIICHDVVQYLPDTQAARAMSNLGRLCRGALYFHVPTREDWQRTADRSSSDSDVHLRSVQWYRTRLARHFRHAGFGMYVRRGQPLIQWELERAAVP
jgi:SAM-dependent methyltransferase